MTRLQSLRVHPYRLRLVRPWKTAAGATRLRRGFLVRILGQDGALGHGDASLAPGASEKSIVQLRRLLERPSAARDEISRAAASALGYAHADARAKTAGRPLSRVLAELGGRPLPPKHVSVNATLARDRPDRVATAAREASRQGYRCLKLKVGAPESALATVAAVRDAVGTALRVRVDPNAAWTHREARRWLPRLADHGVEYVEQPVRPGPSDRWNQLRKATGTPMAADESVTATGADRFLNTADLDAVVLKPARLGGPHEALRIAQKVQVRSIDVVVTDSVDCAVGRTAALHVAAALGSVRRAHGVASGEWFETDVIARPPRVDHGRLRVPRGPGLGLEALP